MDFLRSVSHVYRASPFGNNQALTGAQTVKVASVTDGLSNTQFVSELLQGAPDDLRGTIWVDDAGAGAYMTRFTPNGIQDILQTLGVWAGSALNNVDNVPGRHHWRRQQPRDSRCTCDSQPVQQLACNDNGRGYNRTAVREAGIQAESIRSLAMVRSIS